MANEASPDPELSQVPNSTVDLVCRAHEGEPGALDRLFSRYYPRVRQIVRKRLGMDLRRHLESTDIVQGTFAQATQAFDKFEWRDDRSLINWLGKFAERKILDAVGYHHADMRDPGKEIEIQNPAADAPTIEIQGSSKTPSEIVASDEVRGVLRECIDALPEIHREAIILRSFGHLRFEEVARETGCASADAARMRYNAAIRELRAEMRRRGCE
jgi:RNA polymerase sigma-70 factor, ECF subfamily